MYVVVFENFNFVRNTVA